MGYFAEWSWFIARLGCGSIIYLDDHEPAHVHVVGDGEARIAITGADGFPRMLSAIGMKASVKRKAMDEVLANQRELLAAWRRLQAGG
jgi:hypothetical protein